MRRSAVLIGTSSLWFAASGAEAQLGWETDTTAVADPAGGFAVPSDTELETRLNHDLRASGVRSQFENGVATLEGMVHSEAERDRATAIARRSPNVHHIQDRIIVIPEASDAIHAGVPLPAAVDAMVSLRLERDARFADRQIDVRANSRNAVTLRGEVESEAEKAAAGRIAADTPSVSEVRNRLVVRPAD